MTYCTLQAASSEILDQCKTIEDQIAGLHSLLSEFIPAMVKQIQGGSVVNYTINTGQTVQTVRVDSMAALIKDYRNILSLYNELVQAFCGTNWTALRDESVFWGSY